MAYVLKKPEADSPGVIVFTHKEFRFFSAERSLLAAAIDRLKTKYVLGMHWGHYATDVVPPPDIAFHLAGAGTLQLRSGASAVVIPLASRNFVPPEFHVSNATKFWDIITVARPMRLKKIDEFFAVLKGILAERPQTKTLLVCPEIPNADERVHYTNIVRDMRERFTEVEQENITLMLLSEDLYPFPLSHTTMAFLYNSSRLFTLFSEQEGESRVIHEALLCGLPVVVRGYLRGGGRDWLDDSNSSQFQDTGDAVNVFLDALEGRKALKVDSEWLATQLRADYTTPLLILELRKVFDELGKPYKGEILHDRLDRGLPSHCHMLPSSIRSPETDDIRSAAAFVTFVNLLTDSGLPIPRRSMGKSIRQTAHKLKQRFAN